jgi:hypothetical protein
MAYDLVYGPRVKQREQEVKVKRHTVEPTHLLLMDHYTIVYGDYSDIQIPDPLEYSTVVVEVPLQGNALLMDL